MTETKYVPEPQSAEDSFSNFKHIHEGIHRLLDKATDMRDLIPCGRAHLAAVDFDRPFQGTTLEDLLKRTEKIAGFVLQVIKQIQDDLRA